MEKEAYERDQTYWACSAQNSKLLPKKKVTNNKKSVGQQIKDRVSPIFDAYRAAQGKK